MLPGSVDAPFVLNGSELVPEEVWGAISLIPLLTAGLVSQVLDVLY